MNKLPTVFEGEVQLLRWSDTSSQGATITLQLANPEDLERFKTMTLAKGKQVGQRLMVAIVEIGDDELPVEQPKKSVGELCIMACNFCTDRNFWKWIEGQYGCDIDNEAMAKDFVLDICSITSRRHLDSNETAAQKFHNEIRKPFVAWRDANARN